jgi:hypothetical protein
MILSEQNLRNPEAGLIFGPNKFSVSFVPLILSPNVSQMAQWYMYMLTRVGRCSGPEFEPWWNHIIYFTFFYLETFWTVCNKISGCAATLIFILMIPIYS